MDSCPDAVGFAFMQVHTTDMHEDEERGMNSITETGDLEEFLTTAEMSGREFLGGALASHACCLTRLGKLFCATYPMQYHRPYRPNFAQHICMP